MPLTKRYIKSTCREIERAETTANDMIEKGHSLLQSAAYMRKTLVENGVIESEIDAQIKGLK